MLLLLNISWCIGRSWCTLHNLLVLLWYRTSCHIFLKTPTDLVGDLGIYLMHTTSQRLSNISVFAIFIVPKLVDDSFSFFHDIFALCVFGSQSLFECLGEFKLLNHFDNSRLSIRVVFISLFFDILLNLFDGMRQTTSYIFVFKLLVELCAWCLVFIGWKVVKFILFIYFFKR